MLTDEFNYFLPKDLIAQHPPTQRGTSRLLHVHGTFRNDSMFSQLPSLIRPYDVLILNNARVLKARMFGKKESGGRVEILIERILDGQHVLAQIRASHPPKQGSRLFLADHLSITVLDRKHDFFHLRFESTEDVPILLEKYGRLPLPPYITHTASAEDEERYQTIYACQPGSIAAPTAGLHFDDRILSELRAQGTQLAYLTLHVGAGTFQPVRVHNIQDHVMHSERYSIPQETVNAILEARSRGGRVVAIGTTTLRALESAAQQDKICSQERETSMFITPGYRFKVVDVLLTNFHLPKSTLLMLTCAFGGMNEILAAYRHAVKRQYRFFSYGDAMLIERQQY
ncbi:tRNA preQ1(34) S-adenosylmethionine ribosyltransferase-isomerase QueA [Candidatus Nitrotoga fabula]|uniref:S-adenosylmethionine:tRNA ribosyltransferase-isomerase n=1 Tax=Candidatus Nitrotoga fabula TaxID=2182327 RepID=A0A916BDU5_9PROT|nr:tRNA preQ1(34) S-adenosylmethionine ribosyltransferase-isomerase QueA [Candidatus Nitrotoga fabula]CAE6738240.1 S-adenosylmethionine:tRNA ribosyltransferase-isomerase [Candidatus Nitrotoga fabula]